MYRLHNIPRKYRKEVKRSEVGRKRKSKKYAGAKAAGPADDGLLSWPNSLCKPLMSNCRPLHARGKGPMRVMCFKATGTRVAHWPAGGVSLPADAHVEALRPTSRPTWRGNGKCDGRSIFGLHSRLAPVRLHAACADAMLSIRPSRITRPFPRA